MRWHPLLLPAVVGCHLFVPDTRTAVDRAREMAPRCRDLSAQSAAELLSPAAIDSVEPSYWHVESGPGNRQARLRGARVHLRPLPALSKESIARTIECHEVSVVLGDSPADPADPYGVVGRWLDIEVDGERDGFVVEVGSDDLSTARELLDRAIRFAVSKSPAGAR